MCPLSKNTTSCLRQYERLFNIDMENVLMTAGGSIDTDLPAEFLSKKTEYGIDTVVACDKGYEALAAIDVTPDIIIGDFDSVSMRDQEAILQDSADKSACEVIRLNPVKDDTDTEAAIRVCAERGAKCIYLFGATGSRVDHVLGNIELLAFAKERNCELVIIDRHNRIRLADKPIRIAREKQWGRFVSLIPYTETVEKLTLRGFKYELTDADIKKGNTLGISNEITEDTADISFSKGLLLVIESSD